MREGMKSTKIFPFAITYQLFRIVVWIMDAPKQLFLAMGVQES